MQEIIAAVKANLDGVVLQQFTEEQKILFKNNYNCKLYFFEYALSPGGDLVIKTTTNNYKNLFYYMGFDANSNNVLKLKIEVGEVVVAVYNIEHARVAQLAQKLGLIS